MFWKKKQKPLSRGYDRANHSADVAAEFLHQIPCEDSHSNPDDTLVIVISGATVSIRSNGSSKYLAQACEFFLQNAKVDGKFGFSFGLDDQGKKTPP